MATMSAKDLVAEASRNIETLSGADAAKLVSDPNVMFVDIRESDELQKTGTLKGALHVPRGLLEFPAQRTNRNSAAAKSWCSIAAPAAGLRWQPRL
jgi:predicted sulfurtransferase